MEEFKPQESTNFTAFFFLLGEPVDQSSPAQLWLDPIPRVSDSVNSKWSLGTYISNKFPGDADSAGSGT